MALNNNEDCRTIKLRNCLQDLKVKGFRAGLSPCEMARISHQCAELHAEQRYHTSWWTLVSLSRLTSWCSRMAVLVILVGAFLQYKDNARSRCAIVNNYLVMEISRPVTDCSICENVYSVLVLENVTRSEFARHAYAGRPVLVRGGAASWPALDTFSFDFFRRLYNVTPGAFQSVEEECQFFPFQTEFLSLNQVFGMPESRAKSGADGGTWYVGWSNCNPGVASVLRDHYSRPDFLPDESESSAIDWIFMGYSGQGASMHLDYVHRPSWQAQISGSKTWQLVPPPECEASCRAITVDVHRGDIILIDTNQWYHDTYIHPGEISITIGSEYD